MDETILGKDGRHFMVVTPSRIAIRDVWPWENRDFTPWLSRNLHHLDILELGRLRLEEVEFLVPGTNRALDILAALPDGRRVAIENQYATTNHDHLTRGLVYALNCGARALVVISEGHLPEFVRLAEYLNGAAAALSPELAVGVFLVTLSVGVIGEWCIPDFEVVARPLSLRGDTEIAEKNPGSVEEFLAGLPTDARRAKAVITQWPTIGGAVVERRAETSLALSIRNPLKANGRTVMAGVDREGRVWLNVGYLWETGAFVDRDQLLEQLHRLAGRLEVVGKAYYCTVSEPDGARLAAAGRWATETIEAYATSPTATNLPEPEETFEAGQGAVDTY